MLVRFAIPERFRKVNDEELQNECPMLVRLDNSERSRLFKSLHFAVNRPPIVWRRFIAERSRFDNEA